MSSAPSPSSSASPAASQVKVALCQMSVTDNKEKNLEHAAELVKRAADQGAQLVILPECFNSPYGPDFFPPYAEPIPEGPTTKALSAIAARHSIYLVGGSFPERDGEKLYNTSLVFDRTGAIIAKHRKVHLFDINVPGKITFQESKTLSPGQELTVFDTDFGRIGLGICFDIRFPEMAQLYQRMGAKFIIYPGAFNMTTGPAHWELLARSRAVDNQLFVAVVSPARSDSSSYVAWGHSSLVDPWGTVVATTEHQEDVLVTEIDLNRCDEIRGQIPSINNKRLDMYDVVRK